MSKHLPSMYTITGAKMRVSVIFRDKLSGEQWLKKNGLDTIPGIQVEAAEVIYYGSNLTVDMKTTEDVQKARLEGA